MKVNSISSSLATPTPQMIQVLKQEAKRAPETKEIEASKAETKVETKTETKPETKAETKPVQADTALSSMFPDVSLHYQVNPDTQKMVLVMVDRKSKEVIRTLPPEELQRMGIDRTFDGLV